MSRHDNIGTSRDPHMKSPLPKFLLIAAVLGVLAFFIGPRACEIISEERDRTGNRATEGGGSDMPIRDK